MISHLFSSFERGEVTKVQTPVSTFQSRRNIKQVEIYWLCIWALMQAIHS
jgi:hypothetical protein